MLRSVLYDYSNVYMVVEVTIVNENGNVGHNDKLVLQTCVPFANPMSKINQTLMGNAKDLDFVMLMFKLLKYIKNHSRWSEIFRAINEAFQ